jgi:hypothetical protein
MDSTRALFVVLGEQVFRIGHQYRSQRLLMVFVAVSRQWLIIPTVES